MLRDMRKSTSAQILRLARVVLVSITMPRCLYCENHSGESANFKKRTPFLQMEIGSVAKKRFSFSP